MTAAPHVVVVGGGFAGLAAAWRVAADGTRVTLLERRPFLGGRVYSFTDPESAAWIDNGPHLFSGAYTETLAFLAAVGAGDMVRLQPRLRVPLAHPRLGRGAIAAPPVPSWAQSGAALLGYRLLPRRDRLRVMTGAVALLVRGPNLAQGSVAAALRSVHQSRAAGERFWTPLVLATLNEEPERAAAAPFLAVLRRVFFAGGRAARFGVATGPLATLTAAAGRALRERGVVLRVGATVASLAVVGERVTGVVLRDGAQVAADAVVLAVPCAALVRLLPPRLREYAPFHGLADVGTSPIVSVHLWLDSVAQLDEPFVGLLGSRTQWLFDGGPGRMASVSSGARFWDDADDQTIAAEVLVEARAALPSLRAARLRRAHVIRERRATISLTPAAERLRPTVQTSLANLLLAGDWVQTGLPATIESAVRSGNAAAAAVQIWLAQGGARLTSPASLPNSAP